MLMEGFMLIETTAGKDKEDTKEPLRRDWSQLLKVCAGLPGS